MESNANGRRPEPRLNPNAVVAVDVVVFTLRPVAAIEDRWQVLLVRRDEPAFGNKLSLPGVLVRADETFDAAARRAVETKAGLDAREWYLEQLGTFGDPGRDTRGRVVSVAHVVLVRSDDVDLVRGRNRHHIAESAHKALGLALREAMAVGAGGVPSSKGLLG